MKKIYFAIIALALLSACGVSADTTYIGKHAGDLNLNGISANVQTIEVDGTKCIIIGRSTALAMSCNWGK